MDENETIERLAVALEGNLALANELKRSTKIMMVSWFLMIFVTVLCVIMVIKIMGWM